MKCYLVTLSLMLSMAQSASATMIFDGSFTESQTVANDPSHENLLAIWDGWHCTPQSDSLNILSASPLGRPGYAARFTQRPGEAYDCGGNAHDQISKSLPTVPRPNHEVWSGWSEMLDPSFQVSPEAQWVHIGFGGWPSVFKGGGLGNTGLSRQYWGGGGTDTETNSLVLLMNQVFYTPSVAAAPFIAYTPRGVWYDWMYHINWAVDSTGFLEVYRRADGQPDYALIWSKYDFPTEYIGYDGQTIDNNALEVRAGPYRNSSSDTTQIQYVYHPKVGTQREDVEYVRTEAVDAGTSGDAGKRPDAQSLADVSVPEPPDAGIDSCIQCSDAAGSDVSASAAAADAGSGCGCRVQGRSRSSLSLVVAMGIMLAARRSERWRLRCRGNKKSSLPSAGSG
jgi:hypothetical protein